MNGKQGPYCSSSSSEYLLFGAPGKNEDFLVAQTVKNLSVMQKIWVLSLGQGDPLEEGMATHSSILVWIIPWTEEPGGLQSKGLQRDMTEQLSTVSA